MLVMRGIPKTMSNINKRNEQRVYEKGCYTRDCKRQGHSAFN